MSRIEQLINEIEEYIDSCKFQPLSTTKIIVNKEELDELLVELRLRIPDEIKQYQKIISNRDAILNEAHQQADSILAQASAHQNYNNIFTTFIYHKKNDRSQHHNSHQITNIPKRCIRRSIHTPK